MALDHTVKRASLQTVYKLTDQKLQTYQGFPWVVGRTRQTPGTGELCGPGWIHAYAHPLLAVFLNPVHANFATPRLWQARAVVGKRDTLKLGCSQLRLEKELPLPLVTLEQTVIFALYCALTVCPAPDFTAWAERWLAGTDRSRTTAYAAAGRAARAAGRALINRHGAEARAAEAARAAALAGRFAAFRPPRAVAAAHAAARAAQWAVSAAAWAGGRLAVLPCAKAATEV